MPDLGLRASDRVGFVRCRRVIRCHCHRKGDSTQRKTGMFFSSLEDPADELAIKHGCVAKVGCDLDVLVNIAVVWMHCLIGHVVGADPMFDEMPNSSCCRCSRCQCRHRPPSFVSSCGISEQPGRRIASKWHLYLASIIVVIPYAYRIQGGSLTSIAVAIEYLRQAENRIW
ncbi:hypothetical protein ZIOFF_020822 [Zingiber officinale]|uniref:Uncharacterized protein n=1 Tax=Zingiber officinale TaxID=94328 RepID=A0A8J5LGS7_ZINOF|nr:hypothetical protein ZIOFF_020822 [Zingiber officinale]